MKGERERGQRASQRTLSEIVGERGQREREREREGRMFPMSRTTPYPLKGCVVRGDWTRGRWDREPLEEWTTVSNSKINNTVPLCFQPFL